MWPFLSAVGPAGGNFLDVCRDLLAILANHTAEMWLARHR